MKRGNTEGEHINNPSSIIPVLIVVINIIHTISRWEIAHYLRATVTCTIIEEEELLLPQGIGCTASTLSWEAREFRWFLNEYVLFGKNSPLVTSWWFPDPTNTDHHSHLPRFSFIQHMPRAQQHVPSIYSSSPLVYERRAAFKVQNSNSNPKFKIQNWESKIYTRRAWGYLPDVKSTAKRVNPCFVELKLKNWP